MNNDKLVTRNSFLTSILRIREVSSYDESDLSDYKRHACERSPYIFSNAKFNIILPRIVPSVGSRMTEYTRARASVPSSLSALAHLHRWENASKATPGCWPLHPSRERRAPPPIPTTTSAPISCPSCALSPCYCRRRIKALDAGWDAPKSLHHARGGERERRIGKRRKREGVSEGEKGREGRRERERETQRQNDEKAAPRQLTAHEATAIAGERWGERERERRAYNLPLGCLWRGEVPPRVPYGRPYFPYLPTFSRPDAGIPSLGFSRLRSFSRFPYVWLNIALLF